MPFFKNLKHKISSKFRFNRIRGVNYSTFLLTLLATIFISAILLYTVRSFQKGQESKRTIYKEQEELLELIKINKELKEQVEMYSSIEYKKIYARENLNLAEKNEMLFFIDRTPSELKIEGLKERQREITFEDNLRYWKRLILGT